MSGEEYKRFYEDYTKKATRFHCDTSRRDYNAQLWYELNRNAISLEMMQKVCEGKDILDMGAAHWPEAHLLNQLNARITKLDIAPDDEDTLECDACETPFDDESFDIIICREVIEHVLDAEKLMGEIRRLLKVGGYAFVTTPNAFSLPPDGGAHRRGYTPRGFLDIFRRYGFEVVDRRGNCPNIFTALMPLAELGYEWPLNEYKELAEKIKDMPDSYYIGTNMFILARKEEDGSRTRP